MAGVFLGGGPTVIGFTGGVFGRGRSYSGVKAFKILSEASSLASSFLWQIPDSTKYSTPLMVTLIVNTNPTSTAFSFSSMIATDLYSLLYLK
jgi:hypothetical protein